MIGNRGISKKSAEKCFEFTLGNLGVGGMASLQPASHSLHGLDFQLWIIQFSINRCGEIVEVSPGGAKAAPSQRDEAWLSSNFPTATNPSRQENHQPWACRQSEIIQTKLHAAPSNQNQAGLTRNAFLEFKREAPKLHFRHRDNQSCDQQLIQNLQGIRSDGGSHLQPWNLEDGSGSDHNL
jgi:hypothetical protein